MAVAVPQCLLHDCASEGALRHGAVTLQALSPLSLQLSAALEHHLLAALLGCWRNSACVGWTEWLRPVRPCLPLLPASLLAWVPSA